LIHIWGSLNTEKYLINIGKVVNISGYLDLVRSDEIIFILEKTTSQIYFTISYK